MKSFASAPFNLCTNMSISGKLRNFAHVMKPLYILTNKNEIIYKQVDVFPYLKTRRLCTF